MKPLFPLVMTGLVTAAGMGGWWHGRVSQLAPRVGKELASVEKDRPATKNEALSQDTLKEWTAQLAEADEATLRELAEALLADRTGSNYLRRMRLLCARWAEVAPRSALEFFEGKEGEWLQVWVMTEWALLDLEAAMAYAGETNCPAKTMAKVGEDLLRERPAAFRAWFQRFGVPLPKLDSQAQKAWLGVIRESPQEWEGLGRAWLADLKDDSSPEHEQKVSGLLTLLASERVERDPAALAWIQELSSSLPVSLRNQCLKEVILKLGRVDPDAALTALGLMQNEPGLGHLRGEIKHEIALHLAQTDVPRAVDWILRGAESIADDFQALANVLSFALVGGHLSPEEAIRLLKPQQDNLPRNIISMALGSMWNGLDAGLLQQVATAISSAEIPSETKREALDGVVKAWLEVDAEAVLAFIQTLPAGEARRSFHADYISSFLRNNLGQGALREGLARIPVEDRAAVIQRNTQSNFNRDVSMEAWHPGGVLNFPDWAEAVAESAPGVDRQENVANLARRWGTFFPSEALNWAAAQADPAEQRAAVRGAVEAWARYDAWSASEWLMAQPQGAVRDAAAHQLARSLREEEPDSAWQWAGAIDDAATRLEARAAVLRRWRSSDPAAAEEAVSALPTLPPAEYQKLSATLAGQDE